MRGDTAVAAARGRVGRGYNTRMRGGKVKREQSGGVVCGVG